MPSKDGTGVGTAYPATKLRRRPPRSRVQVKKQLQEKKAADSSAALESFDQKDHPSLVFWDYMFAKLFSWKLNVVVGTLMYAHLRNPPHSTRKVFARAWRAFKLVLSEKNKF